MKAQSYEIVSQSEDIEAAPVIVDVVNSIEVTARDEDEVSWNQAKCAGCVGATAGCLTSGCFLSLLCATGCIYAAKEEQGAAGDIARSCGSFGIQANKMLRDVDEQHHVVENTKAAASFAWQKAKDANRDYKIVEKTTDCVKSGIRAGYQFTQDHRVVERTARGVGAVISTVAKEMVPTNPSADDQGAAANVTEAESRAEESKVSEKSNGSS